MSNYLISSRGLYIRTRDAKEASRNGDHRKAAGLYFSAARASKRLFQNNKDYYMYLHLSYTERLKSEHCRNVKIIDKIITNLQEAQINIDDDRLDDQLGPVIRYFQTLKFCFTSDYSQLIEQINQVHKITDKTPHYIDSISHVICESLQIAHCINEYNQRRTDEESGDIGAKEIDRRRAALIKCLGNRIRNVSMPGEVTKYFEDFENCLKNADVSPLNIALCIDRFNSLYDNRDDDILFFSRELLTKPIEKMVSHYERHKETRLSISEIISLREGVPLSHKSKETHSMNEYLEILNSIRKWGTNYERSSCTSSKMNENEFRDQLASLLSGMSGGSVTAETKNRSGKTDILVIKRGKITLIGECKIWKGKRSFQDAIQQLLSYTTIRERHTALILFYKNDKMKKLVTKIPEYLQECTSFEKITYAEDSYYICQFSNNDDGDYKVDVAIMLFFTPQLKQKKKLD